MFPVVRLTLSLLRIVSHTSLFVEAQRVLLRLLRPSRADIVARLETRLLSCVRRSTIRHIWVYDQNGHRIHVIEATPQTKHKSKKTVVLVHGHSMAAAFWYRNMDDLTRLGFRVLAVDLLGWGRSHRARFAGNSADDTAAWFVDSLKAVLNQVVPHADSDSDSERRAANGKGVVVSSSTEKTTTSKTATRKMSDDMRQQQEAEKLVGQKQKKMRQNQTLRQQRRVPVTLIGHSLGAYVVYELTRHVNARSLTTSSSSSTSTSTSHAKQSKQEKYYQDNIVVDKLILVSPAAATRPVDFSHALYFSLPPQAIVRHGGLLGFLLFSMKYPRNAAYMRDHLREFTYRLAMQSPASGESAIRPIIRFTGWGTAECVRPLSELVIMDSSVTTSYDINNNGKGNGSANSDSDDDGELRSHMTTTTTTVGLPTAYEKTKTLIIAGDSDSSMPVQGVIDLYRLMKSRNFDVSLSVFDQCDHCPQLEQPLRFADTVSDFLCASPGC